MRTTIRGQISKLDAALPGSSGVRYRDAGFKLSELMDKIGGKSGFMLGPRGERFFLSLEPYLSPEYEDAVFYPQFRFVPSDHEQMRALFSKLKKQ